MIKRRDITREEIESQEVFESRITVIKTLFLQLINLIVYRRTIFINLLSEFLNEEVINNDYSELLDFPFKSEDN
jgi:hypothetical protein